MRILIGSLLTLLAGAAQATGVTPGLYECWAWGQARMLLNVTITGDSTYRGEASGETGTYSLNGNTLTWDSGPLKGIMPDGFTTVFEVREGVPTISYLGTSGSEASFCQNTQKP